MIEFERRFLVPKDNVPTAISQAISSTHITQAYIAKQSGTVVRLRKAKTWTITIKIDTNIPGTVHEYEFTIDSPEAEHLLNNTKTKISKTRYEIPYNDLVIELDVYDDIPDLYLAEVELESDEQSIALSDTLPDWFGQEVTGDKRWSNYNLAQSISI